MAVSRINEAGLNVNQYGNRNLIINGAMRVAQRATSKTGITNGDSGYHTVDRFKFTEAGSPTYQFTMSQSTTSPDGFGHSLKMDCTTAQSSLAAGDGARLDYYVEAQDCQNFAYGTSSAKQLTLSFWVRSNKTGSYRIWFYQNDDGRSNAGSYTIDAANTWEHKSITIAGDTTGIIDNDTGRGLLVSFALAVGTNFTSGTMPTAWEANVTANRFVGQTVNLADSTSNEWYMTGVQLEVGDTATDFEHRTFADELRRCQRYFERRGTDTNGWEFIADAGQLTSATNYQLAVRFNEQMRTTPTLSRTGNLSDVYLVRASNIFAVSSVGLADNTNGRTVLLTGTVANTSGSAGEQTRMQTLTAGNKFFFDAEL